MSQPDETERAFQAYGQIVDLISKEDARVSDGLKWGFVANGALLSFLIDHMVSEKWSVLVTLSEPSHANQWRLGYAFVALLISCVAWALTWASYDQVHSARLQMIAVRKAYEANWSDLIENRVGLPRPYGSRSPGIPSEYRPWWPETFLWLILCFWWLCVPISFLWLMVTTGQLLSVPK
jgi:hypothetical protein